jgi:hypothetical protein
MLRVAQLTYLSRDVFPCVFLLCLFSSTIQHLKAGPERFVASRQALYG